MGRLEDADFAKKSYVRKMREKGRCVILALTV